MLSSRSFPTLVIALACSASAASLSAAGPVPPGTGISGPITADVVVSAEAAPVPDSSLGVAATVLGPEEIARSKATTLLELLRAVPGLDVAQSGGPGGVTSLFLRGTNSNQFLLLVDGVKVNSPYFGGADLAAISTVNIERVEIVRGPFSALYGSEAVGGVVQVFTKRALESGMGGHLEGNATLAAGSLSAREGTASASYATGPVG
ncbi:MAG TPA: TonB-dependent receptor plug domain-containing protein, partial [Thermoanaerobaculia bacterium]